MGDVQPCHEDGEPISCPLYVECKIRAVITKGVFDEWIQKLEEESKDKPWILLYAQDSGPVHILSQGVELDISNDVYGPVLLTFNRS